MVMEASPSPQSVGREFVRQYYTLLNKAPAHLHRFYNNYSSFVHGGLDAPNRETPPVVGQKQIHNRIQQLNFRDCHAKISQVDSQATLGNGVVVQVTGELSNGGAPMRRFTQTFVLAAQSPKKYYVHNDIFRYQDIVFSDEEGEGSARSEGEEEEPRGYFPPPPAYPPAFPAPPLAPAAAPAPAPAQTPVNGLPAPATPADNAVAAERSPPPSPPLVEQPAAPQPQPQPQPQSQPQPQPQPQLQQQPQPQPQPQSQPEREPTPPPQQTAAAAAPAAAPAAPAEPKTYANLLKSGSLHAPRHEHTHHQAAPAPAAAAAPAPERVGRAPRPPREGGPAAGDAPRRDVTGDVRRSASDAAPAQPQGSRRYSDAQQLFLGNLPHAATEDELRALFARFGPVAELRVHAKHAAPGAPRHPNYGFITYELPASAQDCLNNPPMYFPADSTEGVKLNVEEKKARGREAPRRRPPSGSRPPFPRSYRR